MVNRVTLSLLLVAGFMALAVAVACDEEETPPTTTPAAETPVPTATVEEEIEDVENAVDKVVVVIRERDRDRLRDLMGGQLRQRLRDQDLDRLAACVPGGTTVEAISKEVEISGDIATVTVTLRVTQDGETSEIERVWKFERQPDGTWALSELPECPFQ